MQLVNRDSYHNDLELKRSPLQSLAGVIFQLKHGVAMNLK